MHALGLHPTTLYGLALLGLSLLLWLPARRERGDGLGLALAAALLALTLLLGHWQALARLQPLPADGLPALALLPLQLLLGLSALLVPELPPLLTAQLLLLAGYLVVRGLARLLASLLLGLAALWRRLRRPRSDPGSGPRGGSRSGSAVARGLVRTVRGGLLVLALLLAAAPWLLRHLPALPAPFTGLVAAQFGEVIWIGAWVLLLELGARLEVFGRGAPAAAVVDTSAAAPAPDLEPLYRRYLQCHGEALLWSRHEPALTDAGGAPPVAAPAAGAAALLYARLAHLLSPALLHRLLEPARQLDGGGDALLAEALCAHHFLLFSGLIQDCVNHGRSVLLICPAAALPEVRTSLALHGDSSLRALTQRWAELGRDPLLGDADPDLLLCPDSEIESELLGALERFGPRLARLGLILCLDLQALAPAALVRLALTRVRAGTDREAPARLLLQGAALEGIEALARALVVTNRLREFRIQAHLQAPRYVLVWDRGAPTAAARACWFPDLAAPIGLDPLLLLPAWERGLAVARPDPVQRHDEDAFERFQALLPAQGQAALAAMAAAHRPVGHGYVSAAAAVSLLDDPGHLLLALDYDGGSSGHAASLINVLCDNYLLRDWLCAILATRPPQHLPAALRPLAPRPHGNPYTLAYLLFQALRDGRGLDSETLNSQFLDSLPTALRERLGIAANRAGLGRLLALACGEPPPLSVHWPTEGPRTYRLNGVYAPRLATAVPVRDQHGASLGRLLGWDHGLTYASGQTLMLAHKAHQVLAVSDELVRVRHLDQAEPQGWRRYCFHRRYRLPSGVGEGQGDSHPETGPDLRHDLQHEPLYEQPPVRRERPGGLALTVAAMYRPMERTSLGYLSLGEDARPLASTPTAGDYSPCTPPVTWYSPLQGMALLRIDLPADAGVPPGGDPGSEPRARPGTPLGAIAGELRARVAFTLCALMQDSLHSLFPQQHRRLAVLSPQAAPVQRELTARAETLDAGEDWLLARWYPTLELDNADSPATAIEVYLVEDSRFDLGVARVLGDWPGAQHLMRMLRDYLMWAQQQPPEQLFQAFGASALAPVFAYPETLALLQGLVDAGGDVGVEG